MLMESHLHENMRAYAYKTIVLDLSQTELKPF